MSTSSLWMVSGCTIPQRYGGVFVCLCVHVSLYVHACVHKYMFTESREVDGGRSNLVQLCV